MAGLIKRGEVFYLSHYVGGREVRTSLDTDCLQIAKEKLRQFESAQVRGDPLPLPTATPIPEVVAAYAQHVRTVKTAKSAQTDLYYLREMFGPICPALEIVSRKPSLKAKKRPAKPGQDRRRRAPVIEAASFEKITTAQVSEFIAAQVQARGLAPKTANRYREILCRLFNWAMEQRGLRLPSDRNPVAKVERYRERAAEIRFLTLPQVEDQLNVLANNRQLQTMAAFLIYAGLRREELLWLQVEDIDLEWGAHGLIRVRAKTVDGESWQPKTKQNRAVPMSSDLRRYFDAYTPRMTAGRWLFPSPDGKRWDTDNFSSDLRAANEKAGLRWGCLDYRHTFGSTLAQRGQSLYQISALMGNSPEICRRHYAALVPEALGDVVEFGPCKAQPQGRTQVPMSQAS